MANLFIIGNGFDLAHGIKSSYEDFHKYLLQKYGLVQQSKWVLPYIKNGDCSESEAANLLIKLISAAEKIGNRWCDFETSLGKLDYTRFFQLDDMDIYTEMVKNSLKVTVPKIKCFFREWINDIDINRINKIDAFSNLVNADNDYFISFNYTQVLEKIYNVKKVCHVHGNINGDIIMGHGDHSQIKLTPYSDFKQSVQNKKNTSTKMFKIEKQNTRNSNRYLSEDDITFCISKLRKNGTKNMMQKNIERISRMDRIQKNIIRMNMNVHHTEESRISTNDNITLPELTDTLQKIHNMLEKDTSKAILNILKFLGKLDKKETINRIYSIGFSYADVDMKVIQLISFLGAQSWYLNNYKTDDINSFSRKIKKCSFKGKIKQFDFTKF